MYLIQRKYAGIEYVLDTKIVYRHIICIEYRESMLVLNGKYLSPLDMDWDVMNYIVAIDVT